MAFDLDDAEAKEAFEEAEDLDLVLAQKGKMDLDEDEMAALEDAVAELEEMCGDDEDCMRKAARKHLKEEFDLDEDELAEIEDAIEEAIEAEDF